MKNKLILITSLIMIGLGILWPSPAESQQNPVIDRVDGGTWIHYRVSADSNAVFTSNVFDASEAISWFTMTSSNVFAYVVTGTANDSLTYVRLLGMMSDGIDRIFDTLNTNKATPKESTINTFAPRYTQWKITGKVFDTGTVPAVVNIDIFIPRFLKP